MLLPLLLLLLSPCYGQRAADLAYGQSSNTTRAFGTSATSLKLRAGTSFLISSSATVRDSRLFVCDFENGRVVSSPIPATLTSWENDYLGPIDLTEPLQTVATDRQMLGPSSIAFDSRGGAFVSDPQAHRILYFNSSALSDPTPSRRTAEFVIGQTDFSSVSSNAGDSGLREPTAMALDAEDNLYVCDTGNNRVVRLPFGQLRFDRVWGQENMTENLVNRGQGSPNRNTLARPQGIALDEARGLMYISEQGNNRVTRWAISGDEASFVYHQSGLFTDGGCSGQSPCTRALCQPAGIALDLRGDLWVADVVKNRVVRFPRNSTTGLPDPEMDVVYGQPDFNVCAPPDCSPTASDSNMCSPSAVAVDIAGRVFVTDQGYNRVLQFGLGDAAAPLTAATPPSTIVGSATIPSAIIVTVTVFLNVTENLVSQGGLIIGNGAQAIVGGTLSIGGQLTVTIPAASTRPRPPVTVGTLVVKPGAALSTLISTEPVNVTSITILVATYSLYGGGSFASLRATSTFANSACYQLGEPSQQFSSSSLSVVVVVTPICSPSPGDAPSSIPSSDGLSQGAIIGIAVGCAVVGILIAVIIVAIITIRRKRTIDLVHSQIVQREMEMNRYNTTGHG